MHTQNKSAAAGHTAGPWKWTGTRSNPRSQCYLTGKNDAPVAVALDGLGASAQDARLIASAPELLEALEKSVAVMDNTPGLGEAGRHILRDARAALARARARRPTEPIPGGLHLVS